MAVYHSFANGYAKDILSEFWIRSYVTQKGKVLKNKSKPYLCKHI